MCEQKTRPGLITVDAFLASVDPARRDDVDTLLQLMHEVTAADPVIWGDSIVGFGAYDYTYNSGWQGTSFVTGFSPRKRNIAVYIMPGFETCEELLDRLGPHSKGKSCLYLTRLARINLEVLAELVSESVEIMKSRYDVRMPKSKT
ncbi:MAG: hypothetical protein DHS20C01_06570 [marine bacterium B5-7]|nr:MAG: hypothetical protein DHS20C01_06570 [marine bacterium B5-7]